MNTYSIVPYDALINQKNNPNYKINLYQLVKDGHAYYQVQNQRITDLLNQYYQNISTEPGSFISDIDLINQTLAQEKYNNDLYLILSKLLSRPLIPNTSDQMLTDENSRFKLLFKNPGVNSAIIGQGSFGSVYWLEYRDDVNLTNFMVKISSNISEDRILYESFVGLKALNKLRRIIPNFVFIYHVIKCVGNTDLWCVPNVNSPYQVIMENIVNHDGTKALSFKRFIIDCSTEDLINVIIQVFFSISLANDRFKFIHGDLHGSNLLIQTLDREYQLNYGHFYLKTKFIVKIIDYGLSQINIDNIKYTGNILDVHNHITDYYRFTMEIFKIIIQNLNTKDQQNKLKYVIEIMKVFFGEENIIMNQLDYQKRLEQLILLIDRNDLFNAGDLNIYADKFKFSDYLIHIIYSKNPKLKIFQQMATKNKDMSVPMYNCDQLICKVTDKTFKPSSEVIFVTKDFITELMYNLDYFPQMLFINPSKGDEIKTRLINEINMLTEELKIILQKDEIKKRFVDFHGNQEFKNMNTKYQNIDLIINRLGQITNVDQVKDAFEQLSLYQKFFNLIYETDELDNIDFFAYEFGTILEQIQINDLNLIKRSLMARNIPFNLNGRIDDLRKLLTTVSKSQQINFQSISPVPENLFNTESQMIGVNPSFQLIDEQPSIPVSNFQNPTKFQSSKSSYPILYSPSPDSPDSPSYQFNASQLQNPIQLVSFSSTNPILPQVPNIDTSITSIRSPRFGGPGLEFNQLVGLKPESYDPERLTSPGNSQQKGSYLFQVQNLV